MATMDVMDAVVKVMEDEGVEVAFGVPGAAILPLYKAMSAVGPDQGTTRSGTRKAGRTRPTGTRGSRARSGSTSGPAGRRGRT